MKAAFPLTLQFAQDCTAEQLGRFCGMSAIWADGVLDAIGGETHTRPWSPPADMTEEEEADHLAGFVRGNELRRSIEQCQELLLATWFKHTTADLIVPQARKRVLRNQARALLRDAARVCEYAG